MAMRKRRRLQDAYRFPGLQPLTTVRGVFGDPQVLVAIDESSIRKGPHLLDRSQPSGSDAPDLVRRHGPVGSQHGRVLRLARAEEVSHSVGAGPTGCATRSID